MVHGRPGTTLHQIGSFDKNKPAGTRWNASRPAPLRVVTVQEVAGFGGPPKMLAAFRLSAFAFSFSA